MSKLFFSCTVFLLVSYTLSSQDTYLGIKAGYTSSSLNSTTSPNPQLQNRKSLNFALVYNYQFNQTLGFTFEPGFMIKGSKITNDTLDYKFHYLSMPILFDFYPIKKVKVSVGPEIAYLSNATNRVNDTITFSLLNTYNNRWEFSGIASLSYSASFFLDLGVRYSKSFTKVASFDAILNRRELYNEYVQVFVLFKILN